MGMKDSIDIPLYLFAKAPVAGKVKTRMQPQLTPEQSATLATQMLEQSMMRIFQGWPGKRILTVSPDDELPLFHALCRRYRFEIEVQIEGDLGMRMAHCIKQGIAQQGVCAVMGCDVPHVSQTIIGDFHKAMFEGENVVGPADDGGFYFLGLHQFEEALFDGISWGGTAVLSDMQKNGEAEGIRLCEYSTLRDIDNWDDLYWLASVDSSYSIYV